MALSQLEGRPLHVSYDIDACDPAIAPHTGTAVRGGLNFREAHYVVEAIAETGTRKKRREANRRVVQVEGSTFGVRADICFLSLFLSFFLFFFLSCFRPSGVA
jgi:hypothetical protein